MNPQANMAAMNVGGGPVGGMQMMNGGMVRQEPNPGQDQLTMLNTYIYDYFLKKQHYGLARQLLKELSIKVVQGSKSSPNRNNVNGVDDSDNKDDIHQRPDDLPNANIPDDSGVDTCFLVDWWSQFWDIYSAQRGKANGRSQTLQYLQFNRQAKMQQQQDQQRILMAQRPIMGQRNGMMQSSIPRAAMVNAQNATASPLHNMQQASMQMGKMQRDGAGMDMNGQRPQSPANTENAPSPPKRPRLEGQNFNGQPMGPGRTQPMPGQPMNATAAQATQMLMANGINPSTMSQEQLNAFASTGQIPGKNMEALAKGLNSAGGAPNNQMAQQGLDEQAFLNNGQGAMRQGGPQPPQGNHALQDYQMQLMLLEQQNKKRLLMARQEQDSMAQTPHGGPGGVQLGQQGFAPAMSPQGSRAGPSPNPSDQMKRGTPKMGQNPLPGSPMPDGMQQNRASPIPNGNYDPSTMNQGVPPQFYQQMNQGNPMNMRAPPSSHPGFQPTPQQIEALRANGGRMPNGWPQGPPQLMQQQQGQQPQPVAMGTPQQRNPMGPPPAPPGGVEPGRTQPSSPAPPAAQPPTPNPTNKAAPKKKPDAKPKKNAKKAAANATPSEEPTPTPSTPITPHPPAGSFNGQKPGQIQMGNGQQQAPPLAGPPQQQIDEPFGTIPGPGPQSFDLNFPLDTGDVLESFDFDSFLQDTEEGNAFALGGDFGFGADSVEAGTEM